MLKGEVGLHGPPGPTLFVQPPDLNLYKGEKVSPTYRLRHLVKQDWETSHRYRAGLLCLIT